MAIALERLHAAPWNARKSTEEAPLADLAESIRQHGVQAPLLVRPWNASAEGTVTDFEIICGHRRHAAARRAGLDTVPCIIRDLGDDKAREIGLVDNLQREDLPAVEEAAAFAELLKRLGSIAAVAARVGKEQAYVAKRLRLCSLTPAAVRALGELLITVDHALLLARLGADEQDAALKWCLDAQAGAKTPVGKVIDERLDKGRKNENRYFGRVWEPQTVQKLKEHIEDDGGTALSRAPWDLDDAQLLPEVPACNACPQNTKANAPLFGDLEIGEATCTDGACFKAKTDAFVQIQLNALAAAPAKELGRASAGDVQILRVSWKMTSQPPRQLKDGGGANPDQIFRAGQWVEAKKKSCENARPAVTVDWSDSGGRGYMGSAKKLRKPGETLLVCVAAKCKAHPKEYEKPKPANGGGYDAAAEKAKAEKLRQAAIAETKIRVLVAARAIEGVKALPAEALRMLLASHSTWGDKEKARQAVLPGYAKRLKTAKADSVEFARVVALLSLDDLCVWEHLGAKSGREAFLASVRRLGFAGAEKAWEEAKKGGKSASPQVSELAKKAAKTAPAKPRKPVLSAEARKRIAAAQKKRWAQQQAAKKGGGK